jgi:acetyltransferase-like isoleucine patch superfamily enzyme
MDTTQIVRVIKYLWKTSRKYLISPESYARSIGVTIGKNCRIVTRNFGTEPFLIEIGNHVEITSGVSFITHDGGVWIFYDIDPTIDVFGRIKIGSNTYIGINSTILPGVTIGNNCVIGACSVVTKNIPDNTVAAGVPCRFVCSTSEYLERMSRINAKTKLMEWKSKKRLLQSLNNDNLVVKSTLNHTLNNKSE